ncbi:MAG: glycine cleavage T C-terminal barrel domain-containing protein [Pseudomonadota bacterium]
MSEIQNKKKAAFFSPFNLLAPLFALGIFIYLSGIPFFEKFENLTLDQRIKFRHTHQEPIDPRIFLIGIDEPSLEIEKGFRHFGHDISDEDDIFEAGMSFLISKTKSADYIGKKAIEKKRTKPLAKRLVQFSLKDPSPMLYHNEPILRDGQIVGYITSGNYSHHQQSAIGMGYVQINNNEKPKDLLNSKYEIEVAGNRFSASASLNGWYDPKHLKMKD